MHFEFLVEDLSGEKALSVLFPKIVGPEHTFRIHAYKGIGRIPKDLNASADPAKRILLDRLPRLLQGYGRTPGIDAVVVVLDSPSSPSIVQSRRCIGVSCSSARATSSAAFREPARRPVSEALVLHQ